MASEDALAGMMHDSGASKAPPKQVHTMVITRVPGKGHHVTHHHTHPQHHAAESQMVNTPANGSLDSLHDHMEDHMGSPNPGEQEAEDGNYE